MASPAQIANDLAARAAFLHGRDRAAEALCRDAARVIRAYLSGPPPDGRTVAGVLGRLYGTNRGGADHLASLARAAAAIRTLRAEGRS